MTDGAGTDGSAWGPPGSPPGPPGMSPAGPSPYGVPPAPFQGGHPTPPPGFAPPSAVPPPGPAGPASGPFGVPGPPGAIPPPSYPGTGPAPASTGSGQWYESTTTLGQVGFGVAAVFGLASFLTWFTVSAGPFSIGINGFKNGSDMWFGPPGGWVFLVVGVAVAAISWAYSMKGSLNLEAARVALIGCGAVALIWIVIAYQHINGQIDKSNADTSNEFSIGKASVSIGAGIYLGVLAAGATIALGIMAARSRSNARPTPAAGF